MDSLDAIKVVCLGGGTGLSTLLSGFKHISVHAPYQIRGHAVTLNHITGIVTVSDDGGSSGRIRDQFDTPSPGDIRNCLVALASDELLMTRLFRYRFKSNGELNEHSLGNLLLTALTDITGDFVQAVKLSSQVLAVQGRILPSTARNVRLRALLDNGTEIWGESHISEAGQRIVRISMEPDDCLPLPEAVEAVLDADVITLGPGSLYTSLLPNLLVHHLVEAIEASPAVKILVGNLMTEKGETDRFSASDHLVALFSHVAGRRLFEHILLNSEPVSAPMIEQYGAEEAAPVANDVERLEAIGLKVHLYPLLHEERVVRHHSVRLAQAILEIFEKEKGKTG